HLRGPKRARARHPDRQVDRGRRRPDPRRLRQHLRRQLKDAPMKLYIAKNHLGALLLALLPLSCSSDDEPGAATGNLVGALGKNNRPVPAAADRIDRAGRPAISAALVSTFAPDAQQADLERYNTSGNANPAFVPIMASSLAILDGIDGVCGNQLLADMSLA